MLKINAKFIEVNVFLKSLEILNAFLSSFSYISNHHNQVHYQASAIDHDCEDNEEACYEREFVGIGDK